MTVRPATVADVPAAVRMGLAFRAAYATHLRENPEAMDRIARFLLDPPHVLLVAEGVEGVMGMLGLAVIPHPLSGDPYASELFWWVDPGPRVTGAGLALLAAAETHARTVGAVAIHMGALATNPTIVALYTRRGYTPRDTTYERAL